MLDEIGFPTSVFLPNWGYAPRFCKCEKGKAGMIEFFNNPPQENIDYRNDIIKKTLVKSGVNERFIEKKLDDLKDSEGIYNLASRYCETWKKRKEKGEGLYLWGVVGCGKTHTATAIVNELAKKNQVITSFYNLADALGKIKDSFDNEASSDGNLIEEMKKSELLVLDDVGTEKVSEWVLEQLYGLINHRYENNLPIIITSNLSFENLKKKYGDRIHSRLVQICMVVKFKGEDRRQSLRPSF